MWLPPTSQRPPSQRNRANLGSNLNHPTKILHPPPPPGKKDISPLAAHNQHAKALSQDNSVRIRPNPRYFYKLRELWPRNVFRAKDKGMPTCVKARSPPLLCLFAWLGGYLVYAGWIQSTSNRLCVRPCRTTSHIYACISFTFSD
jgi:hypothetical protein